MTRWAQRKRIKRWTWRDTLDRIHHIDEVIDTIVSRGIALTVGILAAIGGLLVSLLSNFNSEYATVVQGALATVVFGGSVIILFLAWELARQEYIRQWYFRLFPQELPPLTPPKSTDCLNWLDDDIPNKYWMEEPKPDPTRKHPSGANQLLAMAKPWVVPIR